ncbi:putative GNAT superfamily acetyltransferase [Friedmanniella endophytica]|uniref:Putative GNAT superfamily acetyltransferase n=1 Tax=Microlunatus kandeliicorticis TaxID=1759536 RepID=A0A7W3IQX2_9ACTN|nr:GNAT family N-acetyltransferase [Microlunatus kandeliicorticis]MBA8793580.1 putative GNAT superfamily acetyltransferase [Microlunatus kandeliicorticis]
MTDIHGQHDDPADDPHATAVAAATRAGVTVRALDPLPDPTDAGAVAALCARVWRVPFEQSPAEPSTLIAYAHAGGYVGVAEREGRVVGTAVGFLGRDEPAVPAAGPYLHSHIAAVDADAAGGGVGLALKLHQRAWCLDRGMDRIEWTFDPLIARNAHVNLTRLGAVGVAYLTDFYGPLTDGINVGTPSDRLLVRWPLGVWPPRPGTPPESTAADDLLAVVPRDAETLWRTDPDAALAARLALRATLGRWLAAGSVIAGFDRSVPAYYREEPS